MKKRELELYNKFQKENIYVFLQSNTIKMLESNYNEVKSRIEKFVKQYKIQNCYSTIDLDEQLNLKMLHYSKKVYFDDIPTQFKPCITFKSDEMQYLISYTYSINSINNKLECKIEVIESNIGIN